ncbi:hypothetical protein [Bacillus cereus group sp. BfR-BA-01318]|uniref:hypothetical protein n=1 Tax=unclassified Bacillus cereus group TaxID=2750818 RepID=UPI0012989533|nr:hypothetical protein [Bacillus cereus group sp. BfR-BA-01318]MEB9419858.1 hypothetical protein [Bacillus cereus]MRC76444.1 hypothetical protein [Bacillus thuringiensis]MRD20763.1 hypothetical protein [Bacillus thuringiensis]
MELISQYRKLIANIKKEQKILRLAGLIDSWNAFQEDESWSVSVFAGRSSWKTYNIALKALRSKHDCIIFVQGKGSANVLHRHMTEIANSNSDINFVRSSEVRSTPYNITLDDGRNIRIIPVIAYYRENRRGLSFVNCDVMFDEFDDGVMLEEFLQWHRARLSDAHQIICIGSITMREDTKGKEWFGTSQSQYAIDTPNVERILGSNEYSNSNQKELFPSLFVNEYIENAKETAYFKGFAS